MNEVKALEGRSERQKRLNDIRQRAEEITGRAELEGLISELKAMRLSGQEVITSGLGILMTRLQKLDAVKQNKGSGS